MKKVTKDLKNYIGAGAMIIKLKKVLKLMEEIDSEFDTRFSTMAWKSKEHRVSQWESNHCYTIIRNIKDAIKLEEEIRGEAS